MTSIGARSTAQVVVLAGGTGGAKLARGVLDVLDSPARLTVIANTGDDIEIYGAHVSPDPDLVSFWLADLIDERGWGLRGDTFAVMDALRALGMDVWFNLGDRDLAWCLERARMTVQEGLSPTAALARLNEAIGLRARVLPMSDDPVRTWVRSPAGWRSFQEFMIRERAASIQGGEGRGDEEGSVGKASIHHRNKGRDGEEGRAGEEGRIDKGRIDKGRVEEGRIVEGLEFRGAEQAQPSPQALAAIAAADAIVIGPSNPLASIAPILAVPGMRQALAAASAPVVAVSPIVSGRVLKGPTAAFMAFAALECNANGIADFYGEMLDGIVADENVARLPTLQIDTRMDDPSARAEVARRTLDFALALTG